MNAPAALRSMPPGASHEATLVVLPPPSLSLPLKGERDEHGAALS